MKKTLILLLFLISSNKLFAQNEIGPDGDKLLIILLLIIVLGLVFWLLNRFEKKKKSKPKRPFFQFRRIKVNLEKNRPCFPDKLILTVKNTGNVDLDLDKPLLIFDNFWFKRKFKINGMGNRTIYPLYLEKGKTHTLEIDILRFHAHDKKLKKYPKMKIVIFDVKGRRLGSNVVYWRKTLLKY